LARRRRRIQKTAVGEGVDAKLGRGLPGFSKDGPEEYTAEFHQIPKIGPDKGNGVAFDVYVTCGDASEPHPAALPSSITMQG
jgi:hypothetical protein